GLKGAGSQSAGPVEDRGGANRLAQRRRIKQIQDVLKMLDKECVDKLGKERGRLGAELFADRPSEDKAAPVAARARSARAEVEELQKARAAQQLRSDELAAERAQSVEQMRVAE
ncbi:unnamed protein product, partial [Prorocentrum cordatum]